MKLPRDVSGAQLVKALLVLGYPATRQTGSHIRLTLRAAEREAVRPVAVVCLKTGSRGARAGARVPVGDTTDAA